MVFTLSIIFKSEGRKVNYGTGPFGLRKGHLLGKGRRGLVDDISREMVGRGLDNVKD